MRAVWIRVAAVVALAQGAAHASLILLAKPNHGPMEAVVVATMRGHIFNFSGAWRSYWQLYFGYALLAAGVCFIEAALLWLIAPLALVDKHRLAVIVRLVIVANLAHATIVTFYFFYPPLTADVLIVFLLGYSLLPTPLRSSALLTLARGDASSR